MTLFERLRALLARAGRDIGWPQTKEAGWSKRGPEAGDKRYGEALYTAALANAEAWEDEVDLFVDPIAEAKWAEVLAEGERMAAKVAALDAEAMTDEWANEGGAPAGQVPNCS